MSSVTFHMAAPPEVYRARRARLAGTLRRPLVIFAGRARARQYTGNFHPFRAGSNYLYFGGPPLEGAAWIIEPAGDGVAGCTLLRSPADFEDAVWIGESPADDAVAAAAGVGTANLAVPDRLRAVLAGRQAAAIMPPCPPTLKWAEEEKLAGPNPDEQLAIIDLRLIKDEHELAAMRRAADVGVHAHLAAMRACAAGRHEADVLAAMYAVLCAARCEPSFTPIVTVRGEVLHCERCVNKLTAGRLLLVDAGAEEPGGYASDITRTYPVNGSWTSMQRHLYDTVWRAQRAAIAACVPGRRYREIHDLAALTICEGLVQGGLLRGDPADLAARRAHTLFFTHGVGHLIGLDVHDMEDFGDLAGYAAGRSRRTAFGDKFLRMDRELESGMAVTIEPGVYLVPAVWQRQDLVAPFAQAVNRRDIESLLDTRFGGIRLEETIVVRGVGEPGPEVLTSGVPCDPQAIGRILGTA